MPRTDMDARLDAVFSTAAKAGMTELRLKDIVNRVGMKDCESRALATSLANKIQNGETSKVIRVIDPEGNHVLHECESVLDIPAKLQDERTGKTVKTDLSLLTVSYKINQP
ncbi:MAG: hypothetical protein H6867_05295 [Rhodospirillales bacterium]|nr:hypothetical protein [Rhodospirillales bacterium]MCB9994944.1 hypothetical protein [Rhodospirillales bacterium]